MSGYPCSKWYDLLAYLEDTCIYIDIKDEDLNRRQL